ncbi:MAG: FtsH protease activity modulator HflK [Xanthomonadales bacterium]|nr:FtsH protease activity modulator HflK [Xanthomonadales bacterium]
MAWNEPGNGKDPWKSGGGDQPPDLDEVFRKLQNRISGVFGGGGSRRSGGEGGNSGLILLAFAALALWLVVDSVYTIDEPERGVVLRFGKHVKTMQPGLNFTMPRPIDQVVRVDVEQIKSDVAKGYMLTLDENIIDINLATQFRVKNAENYVFNVRDPIETMSQAAESAMRQVIGDNKMDFVLLEGRSEISLQIGEILQSILDRYNTGLEITAVNLQEVRPPQEVKDAFDDAIKAREDKEKSKNEAQAYANRVVPESRGRAARFIEEAEAYKSAITARAEGEAQRFNLLLDEYSKAPEVTRERLYLETMESVLSSTSKVMVDVQQGNNVMYLPLDELMRQTAPAMRRTDSSQDYTNDSAATTPAYDSRQAVRRPRDGG